MKTRKLLVKQLVNEVRITNQDLRKNVLDVCYGFIASELGLLNRCVIYNLYNK